MILKKNKEYAIIPAAMIFSHIVQSLCQGEKDEKEKI